MSTAVIDHELMMRIEADVLRMAAIDRTPAMKKAMRGAVTIVAKRTKEKLYALLPYPGDKKDKKPLAATVGTKVYQLQTGGIVGRVRWMRPAGSHGHLVEAGHKMVGSKTKKKTSSVTTQARKKPPSGRTFVEGRRYLANAWEETKQAQHMAIESGITEAITGKK